VGGWGGGGVNQVALLMQGVHQSHEGVAAGDLLRRDKHNLDAGGLLPEGVHDLSGVLVAHIAAHVPARDASFLHVEHLRNFSALIMIHMGD